MALTQIREFTLIPAPARPTTRAGRSSRWRGELDACPTCKGQGRVYSGPTIGGTIRCPACGQRRVERTLQARTPIRGRIFEAASFETIDAVPGEEAMLAHAARYAADPRGWFVVQGTPGNAKTYALAAMRNVMHASGLGVYYVTGPDLSALLFRCLSQDESDWIDLEAFVDAMRAVDVLMIDEFDKAKWKVDFIFEQLFRIVNTRYEDALPTCIAFNELAPIPDPILSRLKDGRWSPDGQSDGIIVNGARDQRPYLPTLWSK